MNLAFRFFSDEVLRGLYLYKEEVERQYGSGSTAATSDFVVMIRDLIAAMTSRHCREGLRPDSEQVKHIMKFREFLDGWESSGVKLGFLSASTAQGLRVTLESTLSLLEYVTGTLGFKYLLTARLSQDPIENLFGVLRQMSGCNDHPTPTQFLISTNCLSFQSLARSPSRGNVSEGLLNSLLDPSNSCDLKFVQNKLDDLLDVGQLNEVHEMLSACDALPDHRDLVGAKSDSRVTYYVCGYVARRMLKKTKCGDCAELLLRGDSEGPRPKESSLTNHMDRGGLMYPSQALTELVSKIEDAFTHCFSFDKLKSNSIRDLISCLYVNKLKGGRGT